MKLLGIEPYWMHDQTFHMNFIYNRKKFWEPEHQSKSKG